jgi:DNA replication protein DnaC
MRELAVELKQLRMHGMAGAWADLVEQGGNAALESSRWLLEHLLQAETTDRALRSVSHQMHAAKFPVHRDLAGFDFEGSAVDRKLIHTLAEMAFTDAAHNVVLVGGPGTGKTHSIWSMRWSRRRARARPDALRRACCAWMSSSSTSWATCPSARPAGPCCSIC